MDGLALVVMLITSAASVAGMAVLCSAIATRNRKEVRRELFGLPPGDDPWP
jgi:hypothetical protein